MMARTSSIALTALALVACGGATAGTGSTTPHARERPPYTACERAGEVRMAPTVCWNPTGSHWRITAEAPGGSLTFDVELMAGGRVRSTDVTGATPATDEWFAENDELRIFLQNRYVEYRATLHNGTMMLGEAVNIRGDTWAFRADRVHVATQCPSNELPTSTGDEPGCFDVAGSRWSVTAGARSYEIQFGQDGTLISNDPAATTPDDDGWSQEGGTVIFWLDNHATEMTGAIAAGDLAHFSGSGHDASGGTVSFSATAIPTYPPPIH